MKKLWKLWSILTEPKVYWRLFSLLLAIIFWLLAAGDGSIGGVERVIPLTVEVENLPSNLVLMEPPQQLRIKIRGLAPVLDQGEGSIKARLDLTEAVEGTETYPVDIKAPAGVEILSVTPGLVSVYAERIKEWVFPVSLAVLGSEFSEQVPSFIPDPAFATVTGPRSILEKVDYLVAYLALDNGLVKLEGSFPIRALDNEGRNLGLLLIEPAEVEIRAKEKRSGEE